MVSKDEVRPLAKRTLKDCVVLIQIGCESISITFLLRYSVVNYTLAFPSLWRALRAYTLREGPSVR